MNLSKKKATKQVVSIDKLLLLSCCHCKGYVLPFRNSPLRFHFGLQEYPKMKLTASN